MSKYNLEFILHTLNTKAETLRSSLAEFGEDLEISQSQDDKPSGRDFKVSMNTEEPTAVFDICSQFGRIRSIKVK